MAFKMKGSPIKLGSIKGTSGHASALKQTVSPMKSMGGTFAYNPITEKEEQVSNQQAAKIKEARKLADELLENKYNTDYDLAMKKVREMYTDMGLNYETDFNADISFTGLDKYTNPMSKDYNPDIKNLDDLKAYSKANLDTQDEENPIQGDITYEEYPTLGVAETKKQEELDRRDAQATSN